jgi:uncharacterized membrane protein YkoI
MRKRIYPVAAAALLAVSLGGGSAIAKSQPRFDMNQAISIEQALAKAKEIYPNGRVIEAELEDDRGGLWELKLIDADGTKQKLYLDARTGEQKKRAYD